MVGETSKGLMAYTTANFAIRRSAFDRVGGFSEDYGKYGFEDKDLLIRIEQAGLAATVREDIRVSHDDDLNLGAVCLKAEESGQYSASVFRDRFPEAYRQLPYARCDAEQATGMRPFRLAAAPLQHLARAFAAITLLLPSMFFRLQRFAVRVAICTAYFRGTAR